MELTVLRYAYVMMRARLSGARHDQRGVTTLEVVLWTAGLAVLALATIVIITTKVNSASDSIPTGP